MKNTARMVDSRLVKQFIDFHLQRGIKLRSLVKDEDLRRKFQSKTTSAFDGFELNILFRSIAEAKNDVYLGFLDPPMNSALGLAIHKMAANNKTLEDSMHAYTSVRHSIREDMVFKLRDKKSSGTCEFYRNDENLVDPSTEYIFYWYILGTTYRYMCWHIGRKIKLKYVKFRSPAPKYASIYPFDCKIIYNANENGFTFPREYLKNQIIRTEAEFLRNNYTIEGHDDWLVAPGRDTSSTTQAESAIEKLLESSVFNPDIDLVSSEIRISSRALRRKLAAEGENFLSIKDRVRLRVASERLIKSHRPIYAVSQDLGFKEPGDFTRTFKRWTGFTPSQFRKRNQPT